jgi:hypothetical protein
LKNMSSMYFSRYNTAKRVRKMGPSGNWRTQAIVAALKNPFSTRTIHPKVPDGKTHISSGQRLQAVKTIPAAVGPFVHEILLFPGLNNSVTALASGANTTPATATNVDFGTTHAPLITGGGGAGTARQSDQSQLICSWRTVSCGLRLNLVNNADSNEGWFEACRVNLCDPTKFTVVEPVQTQNSDPVYVAASALSAAQLAEVAPFNTQNMAISPTFISGKLRDIHKYSFTLNPNTNDRPFRPMPAFGSDIPMSSLVDTSMDAVLIRIHGSASTQLMAHVVHNQEIIYDENTALYRASTRAGLNPTAMEISETSNPVQAGQVTPSPALRQVAKRSKETALQKRNRKMKKQYAKWQQYRGTVTRRRLFNS